MIGEPLVLVDDQHRAARLRGRGPRALERAPLGLRRSPGVWGRLRPHREGPGKVIATAGKAGGAAQEKPVPEGRRRGCRGACVVVPPAVPAFGGARREQGRRGGRAEAEQPQPAEGLATRKEAVDVVDGDFRGEVAFELVRGESLPRGQASTTEPKRSLAPPERLRIQPVTASASAAPASAPCPAPAPPPTFTFPLVLAQRTPGGSSQRAAPAPRRPHPPPGAAGPPWISAGKVLQR